jgi:hypothetical protein
MSTHGDQRREQHEKPEEFGNALARHAHEEAKRRNGGKELTQPVQFEATVELTPGSMNLCVYFGSASICYRWD